MILKRVVLFALVGLFSVMVSAEPLDKIAAIVNDDVITEQELAEQIAMVSKQVSQQNIKKPSAKDLRRQVLQHLIDVELQLQLAKSNGIGVDDKSLIEALRGVAEKNKIKYSALKSTIEGQGLSFSKYKENIRKEMLIARLQQQTVGQITVPEAEVDAFLKANQERQSLQYHLQDIVLSLPEAPSPEQLKKAKARALALKESLHKGEDFSAAALENSSGETALSGGDLGFRTIASMPKMFVNSVLQMSKGDIAGPIRAPNGYHLIKLVDIKGEMAKKWVTLTRVRHILLKVEPGFSSVEMESKMKHIAEKIKQGSSFASMAKKYSVDLKSAKQGGALGWVHQGELVPEFEKAMTKLKVGQISKPVRSGFGWHLIKVEKRKQIDDSKMYRRQLVTRQLYQRKFFMAVQNWLQQLRANSYVKIYS